MKKNSPKVMGISFFTTERIHNAMTKLFKESGLYSSKSELVRIAIREYLQKLKAKKISPKTINPIMELQEIQEIQDRNIVRIPHTVIDDNGNSVEIIKIHRVLREA